MPFNMCMYTHTYTLLLNWGRLLVLVMDLFLIRQKGRLRLRLDQHWNRSWYAENCFWLFLLLISKSAVFAEREGGMKWNGIFSGIHSLLEG